MFAGARALREMPSQLSGANRDIIRISVAARSTGTRGILTSEWEKPAGMGRDALFDQERRILRSSSRARAGRV